MTKLSVIMSALFLSTSFAPEVLSLQDVAQIQYQIKISLRNKIQFRVAHCLVASGE